MMTQAPSNKEPRELFVGRVEEQKQFRAALRETLKPPRGETLSYVFLLYGGGGIGKTTLARRFLGIATEDKPFAGKVKSLCVDWESEQMRSAAVRVGREHISAEAVFDTI
jgi:ABC-type glutathione transport system ATPase component